MAALKEPLPEMGTIEVLQALHIEVPASELASVRQMLIDTAQVPWTHDEEGQSGDPNFTVFRHHGNDAHSSVRLRLRQSNSGFDVSSINPQGFEDISVQQYNDLLQDFAEIVVTPAIKHNGAAMTLSNKRQSPIDWFKPNAAYALHKFSINKDKKVDYLDPGDKNRWMNFLISAHGSDFADSVFDNLEQWFRHSEGLSDDLSHSLSVDLRSSAKLLRYYDKALSNGHAS